MSSLNEIGALWKRTGKNGEYLSGSIQIEGVAYELKIFPNQYKKQDKHPDMKVFLPAADEQKAPSEPVIQTGTGDAPRSTVTRTAPEYPSEEINPEDIPF